MEMIKDSVMQWLSSIIYKTSTLIACIDPDVNKNTGDLTRSVVT